MEAREKTNSERLRGCAAPRHSLGRPDSINGGTEDENVAKDALEGVFRETQHESRLASTSLSTNECWVRSLRQHSLLRAETKCPPSTFSWTFITMYMYMFNCLGLLHILDGDALASFLDGSLYRRRTWRKLVCSTSLMALLIKSLGSKRFFQFCYWLF